MPAYQAGAITPCMHQCSPRAYTVFVRHHPFKEGWEVRKCTSCGKLSAQDARRFLHG